MYAGPDPADPSRVLIRKLVQTSEKTWCFEESRVTPATSENGLPTVHTTLHRLGGVDVRENVSSEEQELRIKYKPMPNVVGFSLFTRAYQTGSSGSWSLVENSLHKPNQRWADWMKDLCDKRDISSYLLYRWRMN